MTCCDMSGMVSEMRQRYVFMLGIIYVGFLCGGVWLVRE